MKYYIVALFDEETYQVISPIQRNMSKKFRANRNSPIPFVLLTSIENPNLDKLYSVVDKIIAPYKSFRIDASDSVYLFEPTKSINLKIDDKGYIRRLSRSLFDILELNGFTVKSFGDSFISLANLGYLPKDYKKQDVKLNFPEIYNSDNFVKLRIKSVEIWKLPTVKKNTPLKSYILKDF
ncbi:hypothetical protein [Clostridium beijerinckii]|uniref:hypothetical protein n=1 Tax=Clostridium beijerinckii TaxID=1520 RepID=UPI00098C670D|nr:hypothetical protein [Clostridium beijerinckii]NOW88775.1 hypothetical protein [Clostridium beijerinckii]NRT78569.1 hypothetical protein [Clostridium beijerinckii]OOM44896.1 hypothetical protein CBEIJ_34970 [Clostridium beijerinckii]